MQNSEIQRRIQEIENEHLMFKCFSSVFVMYGEGSGLPLLAESPVNYLIPSKKQEIITVQKKHIGSDPRVKSLGVSLGGILEPFGGVEFIREKDIFISYKISELRTWLWFTELAKRILPSYWNAFIADNYFFPPKYWQLVVNEALGEGTLFLCFCTKESIKSDSIRYEIDLAQKRRCFIMLLSFDDCEFPAVLSPHFKFRVNQESMKRILREFDRDESMLGVMMAHEIGITARLCKFICHFEQSIHKHLFEFIVNSPRFRPGQTQSFFGPPTYGQDLLIVEW